MLILNTLSWGPQHGYGVSQAIRSGSSDLLQVETGSLYPMLHRLERNGWLKSAWKQSGNKQRARYYSLTPAGGRRLTRWKQMTAAITALMNPRLGEV
jgi:PadR family transcriptional regulator, regulatory protein PadR